MLGIILIALILGACLFIAIAGGIEIYKREQEGEYVFPSLWGK